MILEKTKEVISKISYAVIMTVILNVIRVTRVFNGWDFILLAIPLIIWFILIKIENNNEKSNNHTLFFNKLHGYYIKDSCIICLFLYMLISYFDISFVDYKHLIFVLFTCLLLIVICNTTKRNTKQILQENKKNETERTTKKLFNTFYMNVEKVYEIAMLLNNKIETTVQKEKTIENANVSEEVSTIELNMGYLDSIKSGLSYKVSNSTTNGETNRVLENFEVKTTKSNLLEVIIKNSKEYCQSNELHEGNLVIFQKSKFELVNSEDTMQILKLLLNGAFNGSIISGQANDMHMEFNLSSLINSFLKDCNYELTFKSGNEEFFIKLPMSFDDDFENGYNVYDLLIGKLSLIGIYRGQDIDDKSKSFSTIFTQAIENENKEKITIKEKKYNLPLKKSSGSNGFDSNIEDLNVVDGEIGYRKYVDVIAIIQEIHVE